MTRLPLAGLTPERQAALEAFKTCDGLHYGMERVIGLHIHRRAGREGCPDVRTGSPTSVEHLSGVSVVGGDHRRNAEDQKSQDQPECWDGSPSTAF
jgi:hypothetical protein